MCQNLLFEDLMFIANKEQFKNINWQQMLPEENLLPLQYTSLSVQVTVQRSYKKVPQFVF